MRISSGRANSAATFMLRDSIRQSKLCSYIYIDEENRQRRG